MTKISIHAMAEFVPGDRVWLQGNPADKKGIKVQAVLWFSNDVPKYGLQRYHFENARTIQELEWFTRKDLLNAEERREALLKLINEG